MLSKVFKSNFLKNILLVAMGTAGAQAITMISSPLVTRIYGPEVFGTMGVFVAVLAIVTPLTALSYPIAIVIPKDDSIAKDIAKLSLYISVSVSILFGLFITLFQESFVNLFKLQSIFNFLFLIPLAMFFDGIQQIMQQWLIRKKMFRLLARISVYQSIVINASKVVLGTIWPTSLVLILLTVLSNALMAAQMFLGMKKKGCVDEQLNFNKSKCDIKKLATSYNDFPLYRTPQILVNSISQSIPMLLLAALFGPATAGFFALGKTALSAPAILIGNSVGNVFYPEIADKVNMGENPLRILNKATLSTFLVGLIPFSLIIIFGDNIFSFVFGPEWRIAGQYAQWMALWLLASLAVRPVIASIPVIKAQGLFLFFELISLLIKIAGLYFGAYYFNALCAVATYSVLTAISYLVLYFLILTILRSRFK